MKPTAHIAKHAVASKIGRFAMLRGPHRAPGSGAPARGLAAGPSVARSLIALCALAAVFALAIDGVAQAEPPGLVPDGSFSQGPYPLGIAVDNSGLASAGDVYTGDPIGSSINRFDASGKLIPPSPFGPEQVVSVAVNPANGDLSVLRFLGTIETYEPNGTPVGLPFSVEDSHNFFVGNYTLVQIAVDASGNVYVPVARKEASPPTEPPKYEPNDEVLEYPPGGCEAASPPCPKVFTGGSGAGRLKEPTGVAVDSSGNLWVADHGDNRIEELNSSGAPVEVNGKPVIIASEGVESLALDGHGDVFAIVNNSADFCGTLAPPCPHLVEYGAGGAQLADVGASSFGAGPHTELSVPSMLAVNEATGRVYVTDASHELVWIYDPPAKPVVGKELTAEVSPSDAKLGALVDPGGIETTYRFEYGTTTAYGQSVPFPEGSVGEGFGSRTVWATAAGLQPGTTYHYRVIATNELAPGGVVGPDQTFTTQSVEQASCHGNEQFRIGFSARLPDCRAYELVTPSTKTSVQIEGAGKPAAGGDAISFTTHEPLPGAPTGGESYVASRGLGGWTSEDIIPPESSSGITCEQKLSGVPAYSSELSKALLFYGRGSRTSEGAPEFLDTECNAEGLQVTSGEPVGYENLLLRDNTTGAYELLNAPPAGVTPADAHFQGASADLSHVVFAELAPLTSNAPAGVENLYEWDEGVLRLASVLKDGAPVRGSLAAPPSGAAVEGSTEIGSPAISTDGSHILFTSGGSLYMRIDGERTVQVDEDQEGSGPSGGSTFQTMSADGSKVLFTDASKLTAKSTAASGEPDLYECEIVEEEQAGKRVATCKLSDLTVATGSEHADVLSVSALGSQDSAHVYFTAKGVLAGNKREYSDSEGHRVVEGAESGKDNLYMWNGGTTTFIATLVEGGIGAVSPDGSWFAFGSIKSLTGYDNFAPPGDGDPVDEIFLYDAVSQQLVCASCNPSGEAPIPSGGSAPQPKQRPLADGGRLFFETNEALVPSDTNGQVDVYEYEDGQPALISTGTSPESSRFIGASESGSDVFFLSRQQLVPRDTEEEAKVIYDARADGGFAEPSPPLACTTADACRAPVSPLPAIFGAPSSATFSGAGNLTPSAVKPKTTLKAKVVKCKKGFIKNKKGKCVRKKTKRRRAKKAAAKRSSNDRRASR